MKINKPLNLPKTYTFDYLVCFQPKETCTSLLAKLFGHVVLWRNITSICCVRIEPTIEGMLIVPYNANVNDFMENLEKDFKTYIWRTKIEDFSKKSYFFEMFSCVSVAKQLLGIKKWCIITPRQLERYIISKNGNL